MSSPSRLLQKRHLFYDQPRPFCSSLLQVVKLFDGLFLGNPQSWREQEFLLNNKIALLVNLAPLELHPHPPKHLSLLPYDFPGRNGQDQTLALPGLLETIAAMESCLRVRQEGVVVVSKGLDSRMVTFAAIYLMIKFRWTCQESLAFLMQRCPEMQILPVHQRLLENFSAHKERDKLSEAFQTEDTAEEKQLLTNTIVNAQVVNMPDFHGLTFHKDPQSQQTSGHCRRVRFKMEVEVINKGGREGNDSKLAAVQTKLRQFIREKCALIKEGSSYNHKAAASEEETDNIVFIKSKDILCRVPRKRAASKTEESPLLAKKSNNSKEREERSKEKAGSALYEDFLIQFKEEDSFFKKSQPLKMFIPLQLELRTEEEGLQSTRRNYVLHNNKRYRLPKKCHTEESITSTYIDPQLPRTKKEDHNRAHTHNNYPPTHNQQTAMFKISKSSKTSSKKIRINTAAMSTLGKESEKCIRFQAEEEGDETVPRIINFNLNVQIDNINVVRQKSLREDKKSRMFGRPHHGKKFSKALSSIVHDA